MIMGYAGVQCLRVSFVILNVVISLGSCGALGLGIWLQIHSSGFGRLIQQYAVTSPSGFLMAAGCVGILVCIMGCCGAWLVNRGLLMTYFIFVLVIFLLEVGVGIYFLIFRDTLTDNARYELKMALKVDYLPHSSMSAAWDGIQQTFGCCGVDSFTDWHWIAAWPRLTIHPDSCCIPEVRAQPKCGQAYNFNLIYPRGCFEVIRDYATRNMYAFAIASVCLAFVQLFGLVASMVLFCAGDQLIPRTFMFRTVEPEFVEVEQVELKPKYVETNLKYVETNL